MRRLSRPSTAAARTTLVAFRMHKVFRSGCQCLSAMNEGFQGYLCQEADQHLQSARRNTPGNRDNATKKSDGINESRRRRLQAVWTRWPNCGNILQRRRRY